LPHAKTDDISDSKSHQLTERNGSLSDSSTWPNSAESSKAFEAPSKRSSSESLTYRNDLGLQVDTKDGHLLTRTDQEKNDYGEKTSDSHTSRNNLRPQLDTSDGHEDKNDNVKKKWMDFQISPTNLKEFATTERIMNKKIAECNIIESLTENSNHAIKQAVLFLFGAGFEDSETIKQLVDRNDGNLRRLVDFAFVGAANEYSMSESAQKAFVQMYTVLAIILSEKGVVGKFPGEPFVRFQRHDSNTCYESAACTWTTLFMRTSEPYYKKKDDQKKISFDDSKDDSKDDSNDKNFVVDSAQQARRYLLGNTQEKQKRVIEKVIRNEGGYTMEMAEMITRVEGDFKSSLNDPAVWQHNNFDNESAALNVDTYGPGLIYNFVMQENFISIGKGLDGKTKLCGDWKFAGTTVDDEGQFIEVREPTEIEKKYETDLHELVKGEIREAEKEQAILRENMRALFEDKDTATGTGEQKSKNVISAHPSSQNDEMKPEAKKDENTLAKKTVCKAGDKHAMVLLAVVQIMEEHPIKKVKKLRNYYVCLNSWQHMPVALMCQEYLQACDTRVIFRIIPAGVEIKDIPANKNRMVDCGSPASMCMDSISKALSPWFCGEIHPEPQNLGWVGCDTVEYKQYIGEDYGDY